MPFLGTIGGGSSRGHGRGLGGGAGLYPFTTFTFTNGGASGQSGPSLATLLSNYNTASNPWLNNTLYYNATNGIQLWTVPASGNYTITATGASGGRGYASGTGINNSGLGAVITGTFALTAGDKIRILVGQVGGDNTGLNGGGGGGTFVMKETGTADTDVYVIAGGGGGGGYYWASDTRNASLTSTSQAGWHGNYGYSLGNGRTNGLGGLVQDNSGGGGGGLRANGATSNYGTGGTNGTGGYSFANGGNAYPGTNYPGGFGGSGSGDWTYWTGGGGGGGYAGGSGGYWYGSGGGGASYNNGLSPSGSQAGSTGHGSVIITKL